MHLNELNIWCLTDFNVELHWSFWMLQNIWKRKKRGSSVLNVFTLINKINKQRNKIHLCWSQRDAPSRRNKIDWYKTTQLCVRWTSGRVQLLSYLRQNGLMMVNCKGPQKSQTEEKFLYMWWAVRILVVEHQVFIFHCPWSSSGSSQENWLCLQTVQISLKLNSQIFPQWSK